MSILDDAGVVTVIGGSCDCFTTSGSFRAGAMVVLALGVWLLDDVAGLNPIHQIFFTIAASSGELYLIFRLQFNPLTVVSLVNRTGRSNNNYYDSGVEQHKKRVVVVVFRNGSLFKIYFKKTTAHTFTHLTHNGAHTLISFCYFCMNRYFL